MEVKDVVQAKNVYAISRDPQSPHHLRPNQISAIPRPENAPSALTSGTGDFSATEPATVRVAGSSDRA